MLTESITGTARLASLPAEALLCTTKELQLQEMSNPVIMRLAQEHHICTFHGLDNVFQPGFVA